MSYLHPEEQHIIDFQASYPADTPVVMLNLLKFNAQANYLPADEALPCSGAEAFARYGQAVTPLIGGVGGSQVWIGRPAAMLIGPQDKDWHLAVLVKYPSAQAFIDMIRSTDYQAASIHRTAALEDSRLIAHQEL